MIAIIDYGAGNLKSVKKAFDHLKVNSKVISSAREWSGFDKLVLPGVGAFGAAAQRLNKAGFIELTKEWLIADKPFLGICLGLQLLFESSTESTDIDGLGFFKGKCVRFQQGKVPQIGWNQIQLKKDSKLLDGITENSFFYFLHGYYIQPENEDIITANTEYGITYPSIVSKGNVYAVQFHPEKSGDVGLQLLKNWVEKC
ncbi:imidazole glycerol phosphate synthase subunit HisH [candidate division KSB1 bacterium]|nr:imidazole glycerol phosphate synthase subunit HisH [candidate division KSB1 bacterium]MBL7095061.1 imidazole glycerol phosphate synthase subunit HisH [candidate division KSB1 bacterium]